ncbi:DUF4232 domain-containing protein [Actinospica robiniae]|uniref:DUF4232 domain-containing protein n=1 Tax=Actinospica robiniae TaxID=304901 RepID=UPI0003F82180|nr:DUF4232 domain-containing protein [Actinospica robiniae]
MSERFDDFVDGLVERASASSAPGPDLARKRAKQRRNRQRLAASTLSLALLGGAGGIAAANLGSVSGNPAPTAHNGTSITPVTSAPASPRPSATATTATPTAGPSTGSSSATSSNSVSSLTPGVYEAGNWFDPSDAPWASSSIRWEPVTELNGPWIGGYVAEVKSSDAGSDNENFFGDGCEVRSLSSGLTATEYEYYTGYDNNAFLNDADTAIAAGMTHLVYFYPDATSADSAWNEIQAQFSACATAETKVNPTTGGDQTGATTQTTHANADQCWSNVVTPANNPKGGGSLDHVCFVRQGNVIAAVDLAVNFSKSAYVSTVAFGSLDTTLLQDIDAGLGGSLHTGSAPVCGTGKVSVAYGPSGKYSSNGAPYRVLVLTNTSGSACTVEGYARVSLVNASGKVVDTAEDGLADPNDSKVYSDSQLTLAPGATASAILSWDSDSSGGTCDHAGVSSVAVAAPYSGTTRTVGTLTDDCGRPVITPLQRGTVTP